ncbi:MAG: HD domain-containing protein, partial [Phycisphaerae bacterium]
QTGFVYATYPSATHTRFEHTVGVMHIAGRIANTLKKRHPNDVDEKTEQRVRLAALLHDVGHSAFSHTSEEIYGTRRDLRKLLAKHGKFEGKGAGEVLSYLVATSKAFRKFFDQIRRHYKIQVSIDEFAPLILGKADPNKRFEADIISGPVDADKLDYFPRDGRSAGIELAVDIERLLHCLSIETETNEDTKYRIMVVRRGGYNAIQQLLFARATLFASVYHHHKVRACDCMVKAVFEYFCDKGLRFKKNAVYGGTMLKSASDFLLFTDQDFFNEAYSHKIVNPPHKLIHDLLYRRLLKRALTITRNTVRDFNDVQQQAGYGQFYNLKEDENELRKLAEKIRKRAKVSVDKYQVWVDIPRDPSFHKAGAAKVNLSSGDGKPRLVQLEKVIPISQWVDTYQHFYAQSFLFGPPDATVRKKLALAAIEILDEDFNLKLNRDAIAHDIQNRISRKLVPL